VADIIYLNRVVDLGNTTTQKEFSELIGVSEAAVSGMISRGVIKIGQPLGEWLIGYCTHIREQAAGRAAKGDLDLATERAALAREQRVRIELQNAVTRREQGPIEAMEDGLADLLAKVGKQLDTIPAKLRIASDKLTADDLDIVSSVIASVRNEIACWNVDWFGTGETEDADVATLD
jgi:phage terminase Nu1 subunit (DNA packaging protein)